MRNLKFRYVKGIAAKLAHEGITPDNFTLDAARVIIDRCVAAPVLNKILEDNTDEVVEELNKIKINP